MYCPYGGGSFSGLNHTAQGRGRYTGGGGYRNTLSIPRGWSPITGQATLIAIIRPRIVIATGGAAIGVTNMGDADSWDMCNIGIAAGGYFKGNHANGTLLLSDVPYTAGDVAMIGFVTESNIASPYQRLYVNGKRQAATSASTLVWSKQPIAGGIYDAYAGNSIDTLAVFGWNRPLADAEMAQMYTTPYQLFDQRGQFLTAAQIAYQRALLLMAGNRVQIPDNLVGQGYKPLVLTPDGNVQQRVASEGTPLILDSTGMRTLASTETLKI